MQTRVYSNAKLTVTVLDKGATGDGAADGGTPGGSGGQMLRTMSEHEKEELSTRLATYLNEPREERVYLSSTEKTTLKMVRMAKRTLPLTLTLPLALTLTLTRTRTRTRTLILTLAPNPNQVRMGKEGTEPATLVSLSVGREEFGEVPAEEVVQKLLQAADYP